MKISVEEGDSKDIVNIRVSNPEEVQIVLRTSEGVTWRWMPSERREVVETSETDRKTLGWPRKTKTALQP